MKNNAFIPPVIKSREYLLSKLRIQKNSIPITKTGTTYNLAQQTRWLSNDNFAVGRWDGTMSIFNYSSEPFTGPKLTAAVNSPSSGGVQMITYIPPRMIVTSNNDSSLSIWITSSDDWSDLKLEDIKTYDNSLDVATNGSWFPCEYDNDTSTLVVGHNSGFLSIWSVNHHHKDIHFIKKIDLRNPKPVNPFDSHAMYGMCILKEIGPDARILCGSDDGYISVVNIHSGDILSQTIFNSEAQRGINSVSVSGNKLLVANCSVGIYDKNLWYFDINLETNEIFYQDSMNLLVDNNRIQSFNFDVEWGEYSGGPCWFAGTEEGILWMGRANAKLDLVGYEALSESSIGAALAFINKPGRLAAAIHNIDQFSTGSP
ncbi:MULTISPECIES: WD40 repeat domain-containing protein [Acetobacter]|uniref:WD40 repeat domain-containing protein n=1 Tax=Acetobacter TaxID=434 RepID=UPI000F5606E2|nr:WD40 repeat domain-containing protein [Acetobacter pasteurianus]GCD60233.1 hypothetical protein NBRC3277_2808 [Acetobacter pasteurianus NBRC 3277]